MVLLSKFKTDSARKKEGQWVLVGEEFEDLEIFTKGLTDDYFDAQSKAQRIAAKKYRNDPTRIPQAERRKINLDCLNKHVLGNVRNLFHDEARQKPVSIEEFKALLYDDDWEKCRDACFMAAGLVSDGLAADAEEAEGPLSKPSPTPSNTVD